MPIYRTFQYIEEYIVSNLPYRVSRYSQNQWFFCLFSPKIPKILRKFWKFPENSENPWTKVVNNNNSAENSKNSPKILKIRRKFLKKKVFFEALISYRIVSYREKNPHIVSISYRVEKKLIATGWSWLTVNFKIPFQTVGKLDLKLLFVSLQLYDMSILNFVFQRLDDINSTLRNSEKHIQVHKLPSRPQII